MIFNFTTQKVFNYLFILKILKCTFRHKSISSDNYCVFFPKLALAALVASAMLYGFTADFTFHISSGQITKCRSLEDLHKHISGDSENKLRLNYFVCVEFCN